MKLLNCAVFAALAVTAISACDGDGAIVRGGNGQINSAATGNIVQTAVNAGSFGTLAAALGATGLDTLLMDESREFTVFAPTDAAFDELGQDRLNELLANPEELSDILLYHVLADQNVDSLTAVSLAGNSVDAANGDPLQISLEGSRLFINQAEVISPDVVSTNGTIHVINKVMLPPQSGSTGSGTGGGAAADGGKNLVETAIEAGTFNTLAVALEAADLVAVLADENAQFTVFAPTDDAFALLGQDAIDSLLADPDTLRNILLYHVISDSAVNAETAVSLAGGDVAMANGEHAGLSLRSGELFINDAKVIVTDVMASNGIIHAIDAVLMPH